MILGVSHIVLTSYNLDHDRIELEKIGWQTRFCHTGISTHPGKRPFMSSQSSSQSLVFMQPPSGIAVELINYSDSPSDSSPSPLQISLPGAALPQGLSTMLQVNTPAQVPSRLFHHVTNREAARTFWMDGVGFKYSHQHTEVGMQLEFPSPVAAWRASIELVERSDKAGSNLVDGPGFRCLSLLSNDLSADGDRLRKAGATSSTGLMRLELNQNELELELFSGPDGVMVELCKVLGRSEK